MSNATFEIVVTEAQQEIARHLLGPGEYFAGSSPACQIQIPHGAVARKFAKISVGQNGRVIVEDLESESGTLLDDLPIVVAGWAPGHLVRFGQVRLELWPVAKERAAAPDARPSPGDAPSHKATPPPIDDDPALVRREPPRGGAPTFRSSEEAASASRLDKSFQKSKRPRNMALAAIGVCGLVLLGLLAQHFLHRGDSSAPSASAEAQSSFLRAVKHIEDGEFSEALPEIEAAIATQPGVANYYFIKGNILESLGDLKQAKAAYSLALERDSGHGQARANRDLCEEILQSDGGTPTPASRAKLAELMHSQRRESEAKAMERP